MRAPVRTLTATFAVLLVGALFAPANVEAKRGKKAKAAEATEAEEAPVKKVDSKVVIRWYKAGLSNDEIVSRAASGGFKRTALARSRLEKAKIPSTLIAELMGEDGGAAEPAEPVAKKVKEPKEPEPMGVTVAVARKGGKADKVAEKKASKIDLKTIREEDIDFDDVPPPQGVPTWVEKENKEREAKAAAAAAAAEKAAAEAPPPAPTGRRKVVVAKGDGE